MAESNEKKGNKPSKASFYPQPKSIQDMQASLSNFKTLSVTLHTDFPDKKEDELIVGCICDVELNRPSTLNALSLEMLEDFERLCDILQESRDIRVVIIRGAGRGFCSGADLTAQVGGSKDGSKPWNSRLLQAQEKFGHAFGRFAKIPQPVICAAHGAAAGGGFALLLHSDIRLCSMDAKMNAAFIRIGLSGCELGTSFYLPKIVGLSNASEILMTGDDIDPKRAYEMGLVSHLLKDKEELKSKAFEIAGKMLRTSPLGLTLTKRQLRSAADGGSLESVMHSEDVRQVLCLNDPDTINFTKTKTSKFTKKRPESKI